MLDGKNHDQALQLNIDESVFTTRSHRRIKVYDELFFGRKHGIRKRDHIEYKEPRVVCIDGATTHSRKNLAACRATIQEINKVVC